MSYVDTAWVELVELHYLKGEVPYRIIKRMRREVVSRLKNKIIETLGYLPSGWDSRVSERHSKVFNGTKYFAEYSFTVDEQEKIGLLDDSEFNNP